MRIAIYVSELDIKGGTHKQVLRLAQYLRDRHHDVQIVTARHVHGLGYPEFAEFKILTLPEDVSTGLIGKLMVRLRPARLAMRMPKADLINIHDNRGILFGFVAKLLGKGQRFVWQINDLHPAFKTGAHSEQPHITARDVPHRLVNRLWAALTDGITVNVGKNRARVKECLAQEATVLFCGVDFPDAEFPPKTASSPFRLLSTGVFFPYRNYETLIASCALVNQGVKIPIELTIIGDTRYNPDYAEKIRALALTSKVALTILENLSQAELDQQIAESHAFAFVNIDQSWGLAVFEAAARTTPVILSKSVGAAELVGGKPGFLMVDPTSAEDIASSIAKLESDPEFQRAVAVMARETVKNMSWESLYCAPSEALFKRLLAT